MAKLEVGFDQLMKDNAHLIRKDFRKTTFQVFSGIVQRTPVDTGVARQAWKLEEGSADVDGLPTVTKITNDTPYIDYLEMGSSKQAPAGMVSVTLSSLGLDYNQEE